MRTGEARKIKRRSRLARPNRAAGRIAGRLRTIVHRRRLSCRRAGAKRTRRARCVRAERRIEGVVAA